MVVSIPACHAGDPAPATAIFFNFSEIPQFYLSFKFIATTKANIY